MHPKDLSINDFIYPLPEERIAKYPLPERDASRLLIYKEGTIREDIYRNLADHIPANALLVFNDTRVVEARLLFQKPTGAVIEIFCLEPHEQYADISTALSQQGSVWWQCLVGGASKWKRGQVLKKIILALQREILLEATYIEKKSDSFVIGLSWSDAAMSFAELLHHAGAIPLPPYIKRDVESSDAERYQTIYARYDGSVAAPTAGLHFTNSLFERLAEKKIQPAYVTLHVGAGTFRPVKSATMKEHAMHAEYIDVNQQAIRDLIAHLDKTIIPIGTTSLRTIESLYWLGVKTAASKLSETQAPELDQWEVYGMPPHDISPREALEALLSWMERNNTQRLFTRTRIIIAPGYKARIADALVTNFHQPQSTLLLLVAALVGEDWKKIYDYALENGFRFLSYGDGCLLWIDQ